MLLERVDGWAREDLQSLLDVHCKLPAHWLQRPLPHVEVVEVFEQPGVIVVHSIEPADDEEDEGS